MTIEQEVLQWLARLVLDGWITEEEAAEVFSAWDEDELELFFPGMIEQQDDNSTLVAAATLAGVIIGFKAETDGLVLQQVFSLGTRPEYPDALQDWWTQRTAFLANQLTSGTMAFQEFARLIDVELQTYLLSQHMGGYGGIRWNLLRPTVIEQRAYMQRFTDQIAWQVHQQSPYSNGYIANRLNLYGGAGRGEYYRGRIAQNIRNGLIGIRYIAVDDGVTCRPCSAAQGFYEPDAGYIPTPGSICLGGGHCRCRLEFVYAV